MNCRNCKYWMAIPPKGWLRKAVTHGHCRRYPPQARSKQTLGVHLSNTKVITVWPITHGADDTCGEWTQR